MRIGIINPTTTRAFAERNEAAGSRIAAPGTSVVSLQPLSGPASIEGHYDEAIAVIGILECLKSDAAAACDGYVIACFGDPGLLAAREATDRPVVGIAEAAFHVAAMVATGFSVVTTLDRTAIIAEHILKLYGLEALCRRVRGTEIPVLDLEDSDDEIAARIEAECRHALDEDRSGAIVLGCAGMADLAAALTVRLGVPVIDGVGAGVKMAEALVGLGVRTSKRGDLASPRPKPVAGTVAHLAWSEASAADDDSRATAEFA